MRHRMCLAATACCIGIGLGTGSVWGNWQDVVISENKKTELNHYNAQHLAVDRRGRPSCLFVSQRGGDKSVDYLVYATGQGAKWNEEVIYQLQHTGHPAAGIKGLALDLGPRDLPQVFLYSSDYPLPDSVFEERWLARTGRRWENRLIRRSVNKLGGAALHDAHLAVDPRGWMHVSGYMHAAFGTSHRARHRYFDGRSYQIEALPRPPGKTDSSPSNLTIDSRGTVHFAYDSKLAYRRGNAETGYPDSSLHYVAWRDGRFATPQTVASRVGPDPQDSSYFVMATAIGLSRAGVPHIAFAAGKQKKGEPIFIYWAWPESDTWQTELVFESEPDATGRFRSAVLNPSFDPEGTPLLAFDSPDGVFVARRTDTGWALDRFEGDLEGFVVDAQGTVHLTTSEANRLNYHFRPHS